MSWWEKDAEGSDDEDGDGGEGDFNTVNDRIIFLIDGRAAMAEKNSNNESHLQNSLTIALAVMKSKIIASGESSSIGLAFFGTKDKDTTGEASAITSSNGVLTLFSLAAPSAQRIRQLQSLIDNPPELKDLVQPHPQTLTNAHACPLKQALWTCSQAFGSNDYRKSDMKRIWIFTNDDNPNAHSPVEQAATLTVARDCSQAGIEISLWHIDPKGREFDADVFYMRLLRATAVGSATASANTTAEPSLATQGTVSTLSQNSGVVDADDADNAVQSRIIGAGAEGFDPNMAGVRRKEHKKRRLGSVLFSLMCPSTAVESTGSGAEDAAKASPHLAVAMYKSIQVAKKPNHTWLYARTNEPIKVVSTYYDTATGEKLTADQISTFLEVGAATESGQAGKVPLNADELKFIKTCGNDSSVGLQLLYFMPRRLLTKDLNVESSYFLFPDDKSVKGSSTLFEVLLRDLVAKELVGVVRFNRTDSAQPRQAALLPQLEQVDEEDGSQLSPAGFYLVQLPFCEDIRFNPAPTVAATAQSALDQHYRQTGDGSLASITRQLVEAVALPEDFSYTRDIQSPAVQQYYSILQALALNQAEGEWSAERDDTMRPPGEVLARCEETGVMARFKAAVGISDDMQHTAPKKRAAPGEAAASKGRGGAAAGAAKKARTAGRDDDGAAGGGGGEGGIEVEGVGNMSEAEIAGWAQSGQLAGLTVAQLKSVCKGLGLPVSGKKADLVALIAGRFP